MKPGDVVCNSLNFSSSLYETTDDYLGMSRTPKSVVAEISPGESVLLLQVLYDLYPVWQDKDRDRGAEPLAKVLTKGGAVGWVGLFSLREWGECVRVYKATQSRLNEGSAEWVSRLLKPGMVACDPPLPSGWTSSQATLYKTVEHYRCDGFDFDCSDGKLLPDEPVLVLELLHNVPQPTNISPTPTATLAKILTRNGAAYWVVARNLFPKD